MSKFVRKDGCVTAYALACGYVQAWSAQADKPAHLRQVSLRIWHEGGPLIHVRAHDHESDGRIFWDSFETYGEAIRRYKRAKRELKSRYAHRAQSHGRETVSPA